MKFSVFLAEISAKFRVSEVGETKEGGEMSTEEISVNFAKNRLRLKIFGEKSFCLGLFRRFFGKKNRNFPTSPARAQDTKSDHDSQAKLVFFSLAQKTWI